MERDREKEGNRKRVVDKQIYIQRETEKDRQRQTERETDRERQRQRKTDRDRQIDRERERERERIKGNVTKIALQVQTFHPRQQGIKVRG